MTAYPAVRSEWQTLRLALAGASLARYGDGEFQLCAGRGIPTQQHDAALSERLRGILQDSGACMVGIPNLCALMERPPSRQKAAFWQPYLSSAPRWLADRPYGSAFVTRPDSAPVIDTPDYWDTVESLWAGRDVTLVYGGVRSLMPADLASARQVAAVLSRPVNAWRDHGELLERIGRPERAILCLGPTATVLAVDLCARGVHALDLGHVGLWLRKHRNGEPMAKTAADMGR